VKNRPEIARRLTELVRVESYTMPLERQGKYFFTKRQPDENQPSIYVRRGLHGGDERLVDAAKLSADQNTSLHIDDVSKDGDLLVYGVQEGGADEQTIRLFDLSKRLDLPDVLPRARYGQVGLAPDKLGLYYSKVESSGTMVYYHRLGTSVGSDLLIFGKKFNDETFGPMQLMESRRRASISTPRICVTRML
jgi:prolyl oligopeptidase